MCSLTSTKCSSPNPDFVPFSSSHILEDVSVAALLEKDKMMAPSCKCSLIEILSSDACSYTTCKSLDHNVTAPSQPKIDESRDIYLYENIRATNDSCSSKNVKTDACSSKFIEIKTNNPPSPNPNIKIGSNNISFPKSIKIEKSIVTVSENTEINTSDLSTSKDIDIDSTDNYSFKNGHEETSDVCVLTNLPSENFRKYKSNFSFSDEKSKDANNFFLGTISKDSSDSFSDSMINQSLLIFDEKENKPVEKILTSGNSSTLSDETFIPISVSLSSRSDLAISPERKKRSMSTENKKIRINCPTPSAGYMNQKSPYTEAFSTDFDDYPPNEVHFMFYFLLKFFLIYLISSMLSLS